jgi:hypothetical protein
MGNSACRAKLTGAPSQDAAMRFDRLDQMRSALDSFCMMAFAERLRAGLKTLLA